MPNDTYAAPDDERDELELEVERARDSFHDSIHRAESQGKDLVKNAFTAAKPTLIAAAAVTGVVVIGIVMFRLMKPKPLRITIPGVTMAPAGRPAATLLRTVVTQVATLAARQIAQRLLQDLSRPPRRLTSGEAFR